MTIDARRVRIVLLLIVVVLALPLMVDFATRSGSVDTTDPGPATEATPTTTNPASAETTESVQSTVTGGTNHTDRQAQADYEPTGLVAYVVDAQGPSQLTIVDRSTGERVFNRSDYDLYHDVDPTPAGEQTLFYVASNIRGEAICPARLESPCAQDVFERVNYSTGEVERLHTRFVNYNGSSNIHDADRVAEGKYLAADIQYDRAYVVDIRTDTVEWTWNAASEFNQSSGGAPNDWTHVNDVEVLEDGRYMVNLRNQDQVVFIDPETGMDHNWTLGADGNHDMLYEQHNADYIPESQGGPAVLVADSENSRIVEYQRRNDTWERTWLWTDERMRWSRDADRLPNNNTLITDTLGTRLLEVSPNGTILWEREVPRGVYEAELLGTGAESDGGLSMAAIRGTANQTDVSSVGGVSGQLQKGFLGLFPPLVLHGFLYVMPTWVSPLSGALLLVDLVIVVLWGLGEGVRFGRRQYRARRGDSGEPPASED
ncbi:arylsulfotransferase family protein [Halorhabdus salina]|uniref:arylsulfotransferase family protein n=1 Tax=Halorhabdus salina TaxID=2750670 RepID=UPI0015EFBEBD|nr:arylsulfotransferase family protein [Halorhabdus salina]